MAFVAIVGVLAVLNLAAANPLGLGFGLNGARLAAHGPHGCPKPPLPEIVPTVVQSVIPAPVNIGPAAPGVIEHASAPYEINYFGKPWVVKHLKSANVNVFGQSPVVVDEYAAPAVNEALAPPAVIVEEVCGAPANVGPAYAPGFAHAAPAPVRLPLPAPVAAAPCL